MHTQITKHTSPSAFKNFFSLLQEKRNYTRSDFFFRGLRNLGAELAEFDVLPLQSFPQASRGRLPLRLLLVVDVGALRALRVDEEANCLPSALYIAPRERK